MKTLKEYFVETIKEELPKFIAVFEAFPTDKLDWQPAPRSRSAIALASDLSEEPGQLVEILETGVMDFDPSQKKNFTTIPDVVREMQTGMEKLMATASAMSDEIWDSAAVMKVGGKDMWTTTRGDMAMGFLLDMIHHRGQLSVYIRPMGGKVPAIYGPSADSKG